MKVGVRMPAGEQSWEAQISAVAALDEPIRRRLYEYVVRQPEPVSRDEAAAAFELPRTTAAFHLDRLVDEDLLDVVHQRRTGRTGPGAGRPAKLYKRSQQPVAVSLPQRRYDLAGQLLATALVQAERSGASPQSVVEEHAYLVGKELGETVRSTHTLNGQDAAVRVLEAHGYEPRAEGASITLVNCPFHTLAQDHPELVCGMNLRLLDGLLDALTPTGLTADLDPAPGRCCVLLKPASGR